MSKLNTTEQMFDLRPHVSADILVTPQPQQQLIMRFRETKFWAKILQSSNHYVYFQQQNKQLNTVSGCLFVFHYFLVKSLQNVLSQFNSCKDLTTNHDPVSTFAFR